FDGWSDVHQGHHVEADVNESAVQVHGGKHAVPVEVTIAEGNAHTQPVKRFAVETEKDADALLSVRHGNHPCDAKHEDIGDQKSGRGGNLVLAQERGKLLADGGEGKSQICAAFMAARGLDADERAAGGAELRARLMVFAAAEKALSGVFHS